MNNYVCIIPPVLITGPNSLDRVAGECKRLGGKKVLVVTDVIVVKLGIAEKIAGMLKDAGIESVVFDAIAGEPTLTDVENGLERFKTEGCDMVIAVGGGSVIDTAKGIAVKANNPEPINKYPGAIVNPKAPLIAVPTTAGTGSEATAVMVITDPETKVKMNPKTLTILPDVAIVDPVLMVSMPPRVTAFTGIDALTHAIEAYVSRKAQPITDLLALKAIALISENLPVAWADGDNIEARNNMALASLLAGIAFSNASTNLVHAMARPLGAYFNIPHGLANAVLLADVMEFSMLGNPKKFADIAEAMGKNTDGLTDITAARLAVQAVRELCQAIEIPSLAVLGVAQPKLLEVSEQMAKDAIASGAVALNPRKADVKQICELYLKAVNV